MFLNRCMDTKKHIALLFLLSYTLAYTTDYKQLTTVDFDQSQEYAGHYNRHQINSPMRHVRNLYNKHIIDNPEYSVEPRIPKIIHHIWLGSPFPEKYISLRQTWLNNHPDWQCILWTEKEIEEFGLINKKLYDQATNYGEKSDIARYEILYRYGGLYVDTDFECVKPFDPLHHYCDFYAGTEYESPLIIFNGLIGAKKNHPILKKCIESLHSLNSASSHQTNNYSKNTLMQTIINQTGPYFFTKCVSEYLPTCTDKTILFPTSYFYPWPHFYQQYKTRAAIEKWIQPETFGIHHWHVSWLDGI